MIQPFPPDAPSTAHEEQLALLISDLADRAQRGEQVNLEEQCKSHPLFAGDLRELWGAVMVAQVAGKSSSVAETMAPASDSPSGSLALPMRLGDYLLLEE